MLHVDGAAVASQPVLSPHTHSVSTPLLLQLGRGWPLVSLTPPQGSLLPGDQLIHPIGHRVSRGWTGRTGTTLGWHLLLGMGNPFSHGPSLGWQCHLSSHTPQSPAVTPLDAQDSCGINHMGIWLPGQCVLGMGTDRGWDVQPLLRAEEQLCLFSICCREQQEKYFFFCYSFYFFETLCVLHRPESIM